MKKRRRLMASSIAISMLLTAVPLNSAASAGSSIGGISPIAEPYAYVADGNFSGEERPYSPDPLVSYRWDDPQADDALEIFLRQPLTASTESAGSFQGVDTLTSGQPDVTVMGTGTILLDFGTEFAGWLEIDSPDLSGSVTLGVSEYNEPAFVNSGPQSPSKTATPVKHGGTYRLELNSELYEGVRFGFINVTDFSKPFHITGVRLVCQTKPVNYNGSFDSDNEMLNRIWYTAAYDVRVNLKKDYFAAILVDRGDRHSWTGDAYPAQAAALTAFGNHDFVLKNLRYTAANPNGIESYELYWIFSLIDYYEYTGDGEGVKSLLTAATSRLDRAYSIYGSNPGLGFFGWDERLGAGFENPNIPENQNSYKLLSIEAWSEFSKVLHEIGRNDLAAKYEGYAQIKTNELRGDPRWYQSYGLHASADAINAGVVSPDILGALYQKNFTDRVNRLSYSPFNQYFILQAMGNAGRYDDAISSVLDMWGGQIAYGGTTFFETYRPGWNDQLGRNDPVPNNQAGYTSLAHPWGAGVLPWLSEEVLGIKATSPGFATFDIKPHLGRQLTRVSGSTPTVHGTIDASFNTATGDCRVVIPQGTTANVGIPKVEKNITGIQVNGLPVSISSEDSDFVYLNDLTAGSYTVKVNYEGQTPAFTEKEYSYAAKFIKEDTETKGSWGGVYGSEGYDLFSYNGNGSDLRMLPDYVSNIRCNKANNTQWTSATSDERALASNSLNFGDRKLGALYTNDPIACQQTFTVDIILKTDRTYTVALYFADWDDGGRRLAVEMFDGETLNLVAPVQIVDDYSGGKYLVYQYDRSVRFRIDQVRGPNATLSGVFFGEGMGEAPSILADTIDDYDPSVTYQGAWTHDPMSGAYANTFSYSNVPGNYAEYEFEGRGISLLSSLESNRGIAEVFVDDVTYGKIDLYSSAAVRQQEVFALDDLPFGKHTIKVVVTGERNSQASGSYVDVDAFVVRKAAADVVVDAIEALPPIDELTLDDEPVIVAVRAAYEALSLEQKALVTNYAYLQAAEAKVAELKLKAALAQAIAAADELLPDGDLYTADTWAAFIAALDAAKDVAEAEDATNEEITEATEALRDAIDALELITVITGDVNGDGEVNASDVVELRKVIAAGNPTPDQIAAGDLNEDGELTKDDVTLLLEQLEIVPGDVSGDGAVAALDIMVIRKALLNDTATDEQLAAGDLDGNGEFGALDIMLLRKMLLTL